MASNCQTGSAERKHLGVHLPAENHGWRLANENTLEKITCRVDSASTDEMKGEPRKRWYCYPDNWQQSHLEKERKAYLEETHWAHPAIGDVKCTERRADVKYTYKCTKHQEDDQGDCKSSTQMMRKPSEFDLCQMRALMFTEVLLNDAKTDPSKYKIIYWMALQDRFAEWHPSKITVRGVTSGIES